MVEKPVAIILVNWNQKDDLEECLSSLRKVEYKNYKIVIIDNNSTDGSVDMVKKMRDTNIQILRNKRNVGFARANNVGVEYAIKQDCEYIMLLNTDTIIDKNTITVLVDFLEKSQNVAAVSPLILFWSIEFASSKSSSGERTYR